MIYFYMYLCVGVGIYLAMAVVNSSSFDEQGIASIIRGLLGILIWPIMLYVLYLNEESLR